MFHLEPALRRLHPAASAGALSVGGNDGGGARRSAAGLRRPDDGAGLILGREAEEEFPLPPRRRPAVVDRSTGLAFGVRSARPAGLGGYFRSALGGSGKPSRCG